MPKNTDSSVESLEPFQVEYQLSRDEFVRGHRRHLRRSFLSFRNLVMASMALAIAALQAQALGPMSWAAAIFGALWLLMVIVAISAYSILPARAYQTQSSNRAQHQVAFDDQSVVIENGERKTLYDLNEVAFDSRDPEFLILKPKRGGLPILIPERAISSAGHAEAMAALIARRVAGGM